MDEISRAFRAMNTDVLAIVSADASRASEAEAALYDVEKLFAEVERVASRFRPESELSRLNKSAGWPFQASPLLFTLVSEARNAAKASDGLFDPTVLGFLVAAGYDRSFDLLVEDRMSRMNAKASRPYSWRDVQLDIQARTILLPQGCGLDLGGIGKGWTVDQAASKLRGFSNYAIDAGGDILVRGAQADGSRWTIGVENPFQPEQDLITLSVRDGAVATSTTAHRRWRQAGREQHHLIDPRTGQPSQSGVIAATVVARTVAHAEVLAKVALLLGPQEGIRFLEERPEVEWILVFADGELRHSKNLSEVTYETKSDNHLTEQLAAFISD